MPAGNWIRSMRFSTHHTPSGASRAIGIASDQRTGSTRRNSSNISGMVESRKPSVLSARENAMSDAMTSSGLVQRASFQRAPKLGPPSVTAATMMVAANRHISTPV